MKGYWNAPEETARVLKGGWLHTGDIGCQDEDGDLFVTGRKKQFLKIGGHRVNPLEIEAVTMEFGGVKEAAAIGAENHIWGQVLKVFVVPSGDDGLKEDELIAFFKTRLPSYKVPASVEIVEALPKNSQGKVDKKRLAGETSDGR
jgi:acyl-CoA synthetase (AMP-forming)/AMP-acid ligase II